MKLNKLAQELNISCDQDIEIKALNTLSDATSDELTFLENKKYISELQYTKAAAVFVKEEFKNMVPSGTVALVCDEPYVALALASAYFAPKVVELEGKDAQIGKDTTIMPNVNIGKNVVIGDNCTILSGAYIGDNVVIGNNTIINANVVVYRDCLIGNDCLIHSGTIIGADGFGFANKAGKYIKIYQNGNVIIKNDVEIGANCTIDRAAFKSTIIGSGVRLDNLIQIAHNCILKDGCILTSQVGIAGSSVLNEYVIMGAQSGVSGHIEIAAFTTISARGGVTKSITEPKKQWAGFPLMEHRPWLKLQAKIFKLLKG
ncbi:MAG: UDP-3-O-(3-hydroxymyristoyl)glucosamine N-acyltransferase [Campylobacteraceae bacterium]|nr:UDP-3-O-(3-hydroxymyristoyl)glucosamine N-acyltransferase [Campylobacteraceae bacterium]